MHRLLYISSTSKPLDEAALAQILAVSRRNNSAAGVTGLLVAGGRRFLQVLEGPDDAVAATFARIGRDPRHHAVVRLASKPVETRLFGAWAMGFRAGGAEARPAAGLNEIVAGLVATIDDPSIRAEFTHFAALHDAA